LAIKALAARGTISGVGRRVGVGKESDIFECVNSEGEVLILKIHRLGRTSFRAIKSKRDYLKGRQSASWFYMSRLAALKEYAYMKALFDNGFVTPIPIDQNRHCIVMNLIDGKPFCNVRTLRHPDRVYSTLMNMIVRLAEYGLIHCDFNEFNLMIGRDESVTMIDFPQMVSTSHANAKYYFDRDVECIRVWFKKRYNFDSDDFPHFFTDTEKRVNLDLQLKASGVEEEEMDAFNREMQRIVREDNKRRKKESNGDDDDDSEDEEGEDEEGDESEDVGDEVDDEKEEEEYVGDDDVDVLSKEVEKAMLTDHGKAMKAEEEAAKKNDESGDEDSEAESEDEVTAAWRAKKEARLEKQKKSREARMVKKTKLPKEERVAKKVMRYKTKESAKSAYSKRNNQKDRAKRRLKEENGI